MDSVFRMPFSLLCGLVDLFFFFSFLSTSPRGTTSSCSCLPYALSLAGPAPVTVVSFSLTLDLACVGPLRRGAERLSSPLPLSDDLITFLISFPSPFFVFSLSEALEPPRPFWLSHFIQIRLIQARRFQLEFRF